MRSSAKRADSQNSETRTAPKTAIADKLKVAPFGAGGRGKLERINSHRGLHLDWCTGAVRKRLVGHLPECSRVRPTSRSMMCSRRHISGLRGLRKASYPELHSSSYILCNHDPFSTWSRQPLPSPRCCPLPLSRPDHHMPTLLIP